MTDTLTETRPTLEDAVSWAWEAYHRAAWDESARRWLRVRDLFPGYPPPFIHAAASLREAGRPEEALALLRSGFEQFAGEPQIVGGIAACLGRLGRASELSAWISQQAQHFPDNPELVVDYLRQCLEREDHAGVAHGGALMERLHPALLARDAGIRGMIADSRLLAAMERVEAALPEPMPPCADDEQVDALRALMLGFESLGENCEFGLVQRHFGVEPLGLLRWTATDVPHLILALDEEFAGVGEREHTRLHAGATEYATAHVRYGMGSHTFIKLDPPNEARIFDRMVVRLAYLRRKLVEDLEANEKIFVYSCEAGASEAQIRDLHRALGRYGSRHLLFVTLAGPGDQPGTVRDLGGGLMCATIGKLGPERRAEGDVWNIATETWREICVAADRIRRDAEAAGPVSAGSAPH